MFTKAVNARLLLTPLATGSCRSVSRGIEFHVDVWDVRRRSVDTSLFPGSHPSAAPAEASPRIVISNSQHFADIFYSTHLKARRRVVTQLARYQYRIRSLSCT